MEISAYNSPVCTVYDVTGHFKDIFCDSVSQRLPLPASEWSSSVSRRTLFVPPMHLRFVSYVPETCQVDILDPNCTDVYRLPLLHIALIDTDDAVEFKKSARDLLKTWESQICGHSSGAQQRLVVHLSQKAALKNKGFSLRDTFFDKLKNDFPSKSGSQRCVQLKSAGAAEDTAGQELWNNLMSRMQDDLLIALDNRTVLLERRIREVLESSALQGNANDSKFCEFFLLKDAYGLTLRSVGLNQEALEHYDGLESIFNLYLDKCDRSVLNAGSPSSEGLWLEQCGPGCRAAHAVAAPLAAELDCLHFREQMRQRRVTILEIRLYVLSHQLQLCLLRGKFTLTAESILRNLRLISSMMREDPNVTHGFRAQWIIMTCIDALRVLEVNGFGASNSMEPELALACSSLCRKGFEALKLLASQLHDISSDIDDVASATKSSIQIYPALKRFTLSDTNHMDEMMEMGVQTGVERNLLSSCSTHLTAKSGHQHLVGVLDQPKQLYTLLLSFLQYSLKCLMSAGRVRNAVDVLADMGDLHLSQGDFKQAEKCYIDAIGYVEDKNWYKILMQLRVQLAKCQKQLGHESDYAASCIWLLSDFSPLDLTQRTAIAADVTQIASVRKTPLILSVQELLTIVTVNAAFKSKSTELWQFGRAHIQVIIWCALPEGLSCDSLDIVCTKSSQSSSDKFAMSSEISKILETKTSNNGKISVTRNQSHEPEDSILFDNPAFDVPGLLPDLPVPIIFARVGENNSGPISGDSNDFDTVDLDSPVRPTLSKKSNITKHVSSSGLADPPSKSGSKTWTFVPDTEDAVTSFRDDHEHPAYVNNELERMGANKRIDYQSKESSSIVQQQEYTFSMARREIVLNHGKNVVTLSTVERISGTIFLSYLEVGKKRIVLRNSDLGGVSVHIPPQEPEVSMSVPEIMPLLFQERQEIEILIEVGDSLGYDSALLELTCGSNMSFYNQDGTTTRNTTRQLQWNVAVERVQIHIIAQPTSFEEAERCSSTPSAVQYGERELVARLILTDLIEEREDVKWMTSMTSTLRFVWPFHSELHVCTSAGTLLLTITLVCTTPIPLILQSHSLSVSSPVLEKCRLIPIGHTVIDVNSTHLVLQPGQRQALFWRLQHDNCDAPQVIGDKSLLHPSCNLSVRFAFDSSPESSCTSYEMAQSMSFDIPTFQFSSKLSPSSDSAESVDSCVVGQVVDFSLTITYNSAATGFRSEDYTGATISFSLSADPKMWVLSGQVRGVIPALASGEACTVALKLMPTTVGLLPLPAPKLYFRKLINDPESALDFENLSRGVQFRSMGPKQFTN